ncbi:cyclin N-terminal domain-containing protein 1 [Parambassis ranga]|uniref:Cyclin N-terminal domain-containing protein 1 n=1 Tax=Parambassis ranga TaxID=210632 RepID=A0A6P7IFA5_9TELE|nr:cyclin N-terminal domain-containing protein 1 [Parambassis ranga]
MAERLCPPSQNDAAGLKFGQVPFELLRDFLIHLNDKNSQNLRSLSECVCDLKHGRVVEDIFMITRVLGLDPLAGYHAIALLQRFMVKHLTDLLSTPTPQGGAAQQPTTSADLIFDKLKDRFPLAVFSCVQLASKLFLYSHIVDNQRAVSFLDSVGHSVSKQALLESELMVLKGLEFRLDVPNPLMYVETLLEVLGHNEPSVPVEHLHQLCRDVLQFISLQRTAIYDSLLMMTTQCGSPSRKQREKFVAVTEDCMLLGVGVIAVAAFIFCVSTCRQVIQELSNVTGISRKSICDFAFVTLMHICDTAPPAV